MTSIELQFVKQYADRHGKMRYYFRRPGFQSVTLPGPPGSEAFMQAYQEALQNAAPKTAGEDRALPGSVDALIIAYRQSADWKRLGASTHRTYGNLLDNFRNRIGKNGRRYGEVPARGLLPRHAHLIVDSMGETPGAARSLIKRLRTVWDFGVLRGFVNSNPFRLVKLPPPGKGFRAWTEADIERFEAYWPEGSRERLALYLLLYTLVRRSDVVKLGRQHRRIMRLQNDETREVKQVEALHFVQTKGSAKAGAEPVDLVIPLHPQLKAALDALPPTNMTYLMTAFGKPFTGPGFTQYFGECARAAGLPARSSPHGLRKAGARRLAEAGCTPHELQGVGGWKSLKDVEHYTKTVARAKLAASAIGKLDRK